MRVSFLPEALDYFNELSSVLYEKEYFGFEEFAVAYVDDLVDDIESSLHLRVKKIAPSYFDRYGKGMQYASFRKNNATQWFVFFSVYDVEGELVYLVRHITNNHIDAQHFI